MRVTFHFRTLIICKRTEIQIENYRAPFFATLPFNRAALPYRSHPVDEVLRDADYNGKRGGNTEESENGRGFVNRQRLGDQHVPRAEGPSRRPALQLTLAYTHVEHLDQTATKCYSINRVECSICSIRDDRSNFF